MQLQALCKAIEALKALKKIATQADLCYVLKLDFWGLSRIYFYSSSFLGRGQFRIKISPQCVVILNPTLFFIYVFANVYFKFSQVEVS